MKKIISLLLVLITVLSLSACTGHIPKEEVDEFIKEISDEQVFDSDFLLGSVNGQTYRNEFIGLEFTADDGWEYLNYEEILKLNNPNSEPVFDDSEDLFKNTDFINPIYASNNTGSDVSFILEKLPNLDPSTYIAIDILEPLIPEMKKSYEESGATNFSYEIKNNTVDGKVVDTFVIECTINSMNMCQLIFTVPLPDYLVSISITAPSKSEAEDLLNNFKWII